MLQGCESTMQPTSGMETADLTRSFGQTAPAAIVLTGATCGRCQQPAAVATRAGDSVTYRCATCAEDERRVELLARARAER